ncbi:MAG TPA: helix-turn-helix domain-containing protein [Trebonia sp.]
MEADLAFVAGLMAEPNRARMLQVLLGGTPQSGTALADAAGISRALASAHLKKLVAGGLVTARPHGRTRLYALASEPVATAIETLTTIAPPAAAARSLNGATRARNLRWARMCYDHLAGVVGVAVAETLLARSALREADDGWTLGSGQVFAEIGIDTDALRHNRRPFARACMDWTERRHHLAGSAGAAVADVLTRQGWVRRQDGSRIVTITQDGTDGLRDWLGLDLAELRRSVA